MARARVNLFPSPTQKRPSNNPQPVFSPVDPFRRQPRQQGTRLDLQAGTVGGVARTQTGPGAIPIESQVERILQASAGLTPGPTGQPAPTSLDALKLLQHQMLQGQGTTGDSTTVAPGGPPTLAPEDVAAAQLVGGAVAGNPFITPAGQSRLSQGLLPLFSDINPAFFKQTDPLIIQQLMALFQGRQIQPESVLSAVEAGRPRGFR